MKKIVCLLLFCILVVAMTACVSASELGMPELPQPSENTAVQADVYDVPVEGDEEPLSLADDESSYSHIIVSIENTRPEYVYDPDTSDDTDNLILTYLAEKPVVYIEGNSAASEKINDFFAYMDEEIATGDYYGVGISDYPGKRVITAQAYDNYQVHVDYNLDINLEFAFSHTVEVMRCDRYVISFLFTDYIFKGEGTGSYSKYAVSFSSETGEPLGTDYFSSVDALKDVLNSRISALAADDDRYGSLVSSPSYADVLSDMCEFGSWYIGKNTVVFLASAVNYEDIESGIYEVELSEDEIKAVADVVYPPVTNIGEGTLDVSDNEESGKPVTDMISFSDEGETVFLDIGGTIYDVRVSRVQYSDAEEKFFTKSVYWAANYMTDCLLQITADIPDGMPDIRIDFCSGGEYKSLLLSQSGYDGKPVLVDSSINAVG